MVRVRRIAFRMLPLALLGVFSCVAVPLTAPEEPEIVVDGKPAQNIKITTVPADLAQPRRPSFQPILPNFSPRPKTSTEPSTDTTGGTTGGTTDGTTGGTTGGTTDGTGGTTNTSPNVIYDAGTWASNMWAGALKGAAPSDNSTGILAVIGVNPLHSGLAVADNTLYFIDKSSSKLRMVDRTSKSVSTNTTITTSFGANPTGLAYDGSRKVLYAADAEKHVIYRIALEGNSVGKAADTVEVIAGISGTSSPARDGKGVAADSATKAILNAPMGICYYGDKLYVADSGSHTVREIDVSSADFPVKVIGGVLGSSGAPVDVTGDPVASAKFNSPRSVAIAAVGTATAVVVADYGNNCLRAIELTATPKVSVLAGVTLKAGTKDGDKSVAELNKPVSVATANDDARTVYFGEEGNFRIRRLSLGATSGDIKTISGGETLNANANATGPKDVARYTSVVGLYVTDADATSKKRTIYAYDVGPANPTVTGTDPTPGPNIREVVGP